jgi:hypothetical protein
MIFMTFHFCQFFQFDLTLGPRVSDNRYHFSVIRTVMTRNIGPRFTDIHEAVVNAFNDRLSGIGSGASTGY